MARLRFFTRNANVNLTALPAPTAQRPASTEAKHRDIVPPNACVPRNFHPEHSHSEPYQISKITPPAAAKIDINTPPRMKVVVPPCVADRHPHSLVKGPRNPYESRSLASMPKVSCTVETSKKKMSFAPVDPKYKRSSPTITTDESTGSMRWHKKLRVGTSKD